MAPPASRAALVIAVLLLMAAMISGAIQMPGVEQPSEAMCTGGTVEEECMPTAASSPAGRRELWGNSYIGYDVLRRGAVPCSWRGASYYNCQPGAEANPYSRGCSSITQCRG